MKNLQLFTIVLFIASVNPGCDQPSKFNSSYKKSVAWLWDQQDEDGGWHSSTHSVLRDGMALTPYILYYLLQVPDDVYPKKKESIDKGIAFIQHSIKESIVKEKEIITEFNYPNYSAAYALRALYFTQTDSVLQQMIAAHLLDQQFMEHRNIHPDQLAYGGWGYGEPDLKAGEYGHVDISHTRRITEALIETKYLVPTYRNEQVVLVKQNNKVTFNASDRIKAITLFLQGAQRSHQDERLYEGCFSRAKLPYDGGFVSSLATLPTNKCQPITIPGAGIYYPSYATATCDGLLALDALQLNQTQAYQDAKQWLLDHQQIDVIDGLSPEDAEQWYIVMHYYHFSVRAEAMMKAGIKGPWIDALKTALIREQGKGGYYINPLGGVNKEDDPLLATIFCVQAFTCLADE